MSVSVKESPVGRNIQLKVYSIRRGPQKMKSKHIGYIVLTASRKKNLDSLCFRVMDWKPMKFNLQVATKNLRTKQMVSVQTKYIHPSAFKMHFVSKRTLQKPTSRVYSAYIVMSFQ